MVYGIVSVALIDAILTECPCLPLSRKRIRTIVFFLSIICTALVLGCTSSAVLESSSDYPWSGEWSLVFEEEFDGKELNPDHWTAIERGAAWNNEDQAYTPENATVAEGLLRIETKRETWTGPTNLPYHPEHPSIVTRNYTSAQVESKNKLSWTYGRFEIRARMEDTPGMLNALWMGAEGGDWPPEIDIAEILGNDPAVLYMTNHYGTWSSQNMNSGSYDFERPLSDDFHVYGVEWEPGIIRWYLDGIEVFQSHEGVPDEPFYLMFCPAVGPNWTGKPSGESVFPLMFYVDWVRVYQREE